MTHRKINRNLVNWGKESVMNTLMNVLGGMAAVADAVAPIALICILH